MCHLGLGWEWKAPKDFSASAPVAPQVPSCLSALPAVPESRMASALSASAPLLPPLAPSGASSGTSATAPSTVLTNVVQRLERREEKLQERLREAYVYQNSGGVHHHFMAICMDSGEFEWRFVRNGCFLAMFLSFEQVAEATSGIILSARPMRHASRMTSRR